MSESKKEISPPSWVNTLLDKLAPYELAEEIKGDLSELFREDLATKSARRSRFNYIINSLGFLTKGFFWRKRISTQSTFIMLSSYFKMARRSLLAYKGNALINIFGLVTGIASALVIFSVIRYELSFDSFHTNADNIYRMIRVTGTGFALTEKSECRSGISFPVPEAIQQETTALEKITSVEFVGGALIEIPGKSGAIERRFNERSGCVLVEPSFFSVFDFKGTGFKWIAGDPVKSLTKPFSVVLTRSASDKFFPEGNAIGSSLKIDKRNDCVVTGIVEDFPSNSDFPFTVLVSYSTLKTVAKNMFTDWTSVDDSHCTFVVPAKGHSVEDVQRQIAKVHASHTGKNIYESRHYLLQPLKEMHFDPRFGNYNGRTITHNTVLALGIIAIFLLLTGCINYVNLATAQSTSRSKEIGLRKVMGSNRKNLVALFLVETFLIVLIAGILALGLSEVLLINLHSLLNITPDVFYFADPIALGSLTLIIITVTLFSGLYPAISISKYNPIASLKNKFATETVGGFSLRKVLVVAQFAITQMLVVGTFVVVMQMRFFQNADIGFVSDAIVNVPIPDSNTAKRESLEQQLRAESFVSSVSSSYTLPGGVDRNRSYRDIRKSSATTHEEVKIYEFQSVDTAFLNLYKIKLLAGRNFQQSDSAHYTIVNRKLMNELQLGGLEDAIGSSLNVDKEKFVVIGVVEDYYSNSLKEGADNIAMIKNDRAYRKMSIKLTGQSGKGSLSDALVEIEKVWKAAYPEFIFEYQFLDENINAFYAQELKYAQLFELFSFTFLLIGCLGLFGLITFVVNRKIKEIAVRKVMGANVPSLLFMFSKEYVKLILISLLLAVPVTYYLANDWLNNFTNHIELQWWLFATPGIAVLVIALLVVCIKSMSAANKNPVEALRCE